MYMSINGHQLSTSQTVQPVRTQMRSRRKAIFNLGFDKCLDSWKDIVKDVDYFSFFCRIWEIVIFVSGLFL